MADGRLIGAFGFVSVKQLTLCSQIIVFWCHITSLDQVERLEGRFVSFVFHCNFTVFRYSSLFNFVEQRRHRPRLWANFKTIKRKINIWTYYRRSVGRHHFDEHPTDVTTTPISDKLAVVWTWHPPTPWPVWTTDSPVYLHRTGSTVKPWPGQSVAVKPCWLGRSRPLRVSSLADDVRSQTWPPANSRETLRV